MERGLSRIAQKQEYCEAQDLESNRQTKQGTEMLKVYADIIADEEKRGYIERVPVESDSANRVHYIPHHAVRTLKISLPLQFA